MLDMGVEALFNTLFFMKRYGHYDTFELDSFYPFELEIYYYMLIAQVKLEKGIE